MGPCFHAAGGGNGGNLQHCSWRHGGTDRSGERRTRREGPDRRPVLNGRRATQCRRMANGTASQSNLGSRVTRRAFVGLAARGASIVALGGTIRLLEPGGRFIRPHTPLPEQEFLSLCIRCDKCRQVCPWGFITLVPITESVVYAGTPRVDGSCARCWRCVAICPTGALRT
jgi:ferredoxin